MNRNRPAPRSSLTHSTLHPHVRSYRQRMAPEQRRRERRRLSREQADHLQTLAELGRGLQVPPAPAALPPTARPAGAGAAARPPPSQQRPSPPPPFALAPVFHSGGAEAGTQLVPLHRSRQAQTSPQAAGRAMPSPAGHGAAAAPGAAPPASPAGSASMQSATSRLAGEAGTASSVSCSGAASAAVLLPRPGLGRSSAATGGSGASLPASTLVHAATSAANFAAGSSPSTACQGGASPAAAWAAGAHGLGSCSPACEDLIELELVDAAGTCVERLPPQPSPQPALLPPSSRTARPSPDTDEALPAHTTPSFLAFVVGVMQEGGPAGGGSGHSTACNSTAAARPLPHAGAEGAGAACAAATIAVNGSPGAAAALSGSGSAWYAPQAGLPALSSQAALLDVPEAGSTSPPRSGGSSQVSSPAAAAASAASSQAGPPAGSAGALLSSFKRVLHGRLQQRPAPRQAAAKQARGRLAPASKQRASTHVVAVAAATAVGADAEDVLPRRPAAGRRSANENWPALA